jgi:AhpD family alkylhydroperoxidase
MTRVKPATPHGLDLVRRLVYASAKRIYGSSLEPTRVVAHHRPLLLGYSAITLASERYSNSVPIRLKKLAMLRAAQIIGCEWCLDFGSKLARDSEIPVEQLHELSSWPQSERFDELERLALEYTDAITRTPAAVSDELSERLRAHFDERQIVELTMTIALENLYSRSNQALGVQSEGFSEPSYCVRPLESAPAPIAEPAAAR